MSNPIFNEFQLRNNAISNFDWHNTWSIQELKSGDIWVIKQRKLICFFIQDYMYLICRAEHQNKWKKESREANYKIRSS